jgi:hypothetical protein
MPRANGICWPTTGCPGSPRPPTGSAFPGMIRSTVFRPRARWRKAALVVRHDEQAEENPLYYRLIMKPNDLGYVAAISLFNDKEWHAGIGVHRSFKAEPFGDRELQLLDVLAPHFQRALRIDKALQQATHRAASLQSVLSELMQWRGGAERAGPGDLPQRRRRAPAVAARRAADGWRQAFAPGIQATRRSCGLRWPACGRARPGSRRWA